MSESWLWMSASDLGRGIASGTIDPRELTEIHLDAIDSHPDGPAIYARTTPERARAEAAAASDRARAGLRIGPLDGVPISWKDLVDTAGTPTESGSALLKGRIPGADAVALARATRAGLVCLGKTHQTELAFSGLGLNPVTATPPNINDPERAPGGSSSGAATSVAFGLAAAGIGSDTGGSVRVPAAWNDLVGLKTTHGAIPLSGVVPLCPRFDTLGPLCRSVEDAALLFATLAGRPAPDLARASLHGLRLHVLADPALGEVRSGPLDAFASALERLQGSGATITRGPLPAVADAIDLSPCVFAAEAYATWRDEIEARPDLMYAPVRERFRSGAAWSAVDFIRAWTRLDALRGDYRDATAGFDAVLMPATPNMPPVTERLLSDPDHFTTENLMTLRSTRIANLLGLCAITLPSGTPGCGFMAMAAPGADARLLRVASALERTLNG